jgi:N-acetyl sugar amidotransferase
MPFKGRICSVGVWDETIPDISFDDNGKSSYCMLQEKLMSDYPRGLKGQNHWQMVVGKIKKKGKHKKYDCIVGVSGGTDSSYLLHICKQEGLRVLAVNLDNGWNSDIAVKNIKKITSALGYDLSTYVIDYDEVKAALRAYMKASLPWIDSPTDMAIKASLYLIAKRERIKYILNGNDFRTEGKQPFQWTYSDSRQFHYLIKKYESIDIKSFPVLSYRKLAWFSIFLGIKVIRPYYFLDYSKQKAQEELIKSYKWEYYGGHHHENIFTKFIISYWLYKKFDIDKRKITLSAQILNGDISRNEVLDKINTEPFDQVQIQSQIEYVCKKLDLSIEEFNTLFNCPNKFFFNYPNSQKFIFRNLSLISFLSSKALLYKPTSISQVELLK